MRSVSLHTDRIDSLRILDLYPKFPYRCLARLELRGGHGIIQHTPSQEDGNSHHDWWIPVGVDPCSFVSGQNEGPYQ